MIFIFLLSEESLSTNNEDYDIDEEIEDGEFPSSPERVIHFDNLSRKIKDLHSDFISGDLDPRPGFQRGYVWDKTKASRLIESILLKVPIPPIYTAQDDDDTEVVIDGQQRLLSIFSFIDGKLPGDKKKFTLSGLKVKKDLNWYSFKDLEKSEQKTILNYSLPLITITKESDKNIRFEIFERLNTGSQPLNHQEIRNCIYRGKYNDFINKLCENDDFQFILNSESLHKRMKDVELILRFFTFQNQTYLNYKPSMKQFLNHEMESNLNMDIMKKKDAEKKFKNSVSLIKSVFGDMAFRRFVKGSKDEPNGHYEERRVNNGLYDILMFGFSQYEKSQIMKKKDIIKEELFNLMTHDNDFINSIAHQTDKKENVQIKFEKWLQCLRDIIGYSGKEPRAFSYELKQKLFKKNPICAYGKCKQEIVSINDAEVDHIEHYWRGGKTIPSNARLLHRYCNRKRGGSD